MLRCLFRGRASSATRSMSLPRSRFALYLDCCPLAAAMRFDDRPPDSASSTPTLEALPGPDGVGDSPGNSRGAGPPSAAADPPRPGLHCHGDSEPRHVTCALTPPRTSGLPPHQRDRPGSGPRFSGIHGGHDDLFGVRPGGPPPVGRDTSASLARDRHCRSRLNERSDIPQSPRLRWGTTYSLRSAPARWHLTRPSEIGTRPPDLTASRQHLRQP